MKINTKNTDKIEKLLAEVQKKARARTVDSALIPRMVEDAEAHLERFGVAKNARKGCAMSHAEKVCCNSYGSHFAESTEVVIERGASDWFVTTCKRTSFGTARGRRDQHMIVSESALASATDRLADNMRLI